MGQKYFPPVVVLEKKRKTKETKNDKTPKAAKENPKRSHRIRGHLGGAKKSREISASIIVESFESLHDTLFKETQPIRISKNNEPSSTSIEYENDVIEEGDMLELEIRI